jgi:hypothetical protein
MAHGTYIVDNNSTLLEDLSTTIVELQDFMATSSASNSLDEDAFLIICDNLLVVNIMLSQLKGLNRIEEHNKRFGQRLSLCGSEDETVELNDNLGVLRKDANGKYVKKD